MSRVLFEGKGGRIVLPDLLLVDRKDGGHLCVDPPRDVWERGELSAEELAQWSYLVAAAGSAMIEALPQLEGGCINYWEAGNWSLHHVACTSICSVAVDSRPIPTGPGEKPLVSSLWTRMSARTSWRVRAVSWPIGTGGARRFDGGETGLIG